MILTFETILWGILSILIILYFISSYFSMGMKTKKIKEKIKKDVLTAKVAQK